MAEQNDPTQRRPHASLTQGALRMLIVIALFILVVALGPLLYVNLAHKATGSPNSASRVTGTWMGRAVLLDNAGGRWNMSPEGSGSWSVMVQSKRRLSTSLDAVEGTVTICSDTGAHISGTFNMGLMNDGEADLNVEQMNRAQATRIDLAFLSPRGPKMLFSATVAEQDMRAVLHRGEPADFEQLCK